MKSDNDDFSFSPTLPTRYSHEASVIIKSIFKNIYFTITVIIVLILFTIMDLLLDFGLKILISDKVIDFGVIFTSFTLLFVLFLTLRPLYRSQKLLDSWGDLFEKNSIMTGMVISMNDKTKEEALSAICEVIDQIGRPLQDFLSKNDNCNDFFDVDIYTKDNQHIFFDILIDKDHFKKDTDRELKNIMEDYGSILVKITENIDIKTVKLFAQDIYNYMKHGHKIGLAMIIGGTIGLDCYQFVDESKDKITRSLIMVEKSRSLIKKQNIDLKS